MELDWELLLDIHKDMPRQGSGRDEYTQKAFELIPKKDSRYRLRTRYADN